MSHICAGCGMEIPYQQCRCVGADQTIIDHETATKESCARDPEFAWQYILELRRLLDTRESALNYIRTVCDNNLDTGSAQDVFGEIGRQVMIVCAICGNKRCPKAENVSFKCTRSNDTGQTGELEQ